MQDLFGEAPEQPLPTTKGRGPNGGKHYVKPAGYAAIPGSGPAGKTCGSCKHNSGKGSRFMKCRLIRVKWTHGRKTDILSRSPACAKWEGVAAPLNKPGNQE